MSLRTMRHRPRTRNILILATALLLLMGGCPVDLDTLTTDLLQAGLESLSTSLVDALSTYLAGN
ncbi:MAG: hypothetical protein JXO22_08925 [Phycisphaerae bacterium]|nr:hypothetical protein [Phycisphaerae bacterium]